jgi:hypothetical protein
MGTARCDSGVAASMNVFLVFLFAVTGDDNRRHLTKSDAKQRQPTTLFRKINNLRIVVGCEMIGPLQH